MSDEEVDRLLSNLDLEHLEPGSNNNSFNTLQQSQVPLLDAVGSSTNVRHKIPSLAPEDEGHGALQSEMGPSPGLNLNSLLTRVLRIKPHLSWENS